MQNFNWVCPHCGHAQAVTESKYSSDDSHVGISHLADGTVSLGWTAIGCANPDCQKLTLWVSLYPDSFNVTKVQWVVNRGHPHFTKRLLPDSVAKPQPAYIPTQLVEDYREACLVQELSPKSAATLARRCLQGMIRDFCKINRRRLVEEIDALNAAVDAGTAPPGVTPESVEAIDHVRHVGNIGAHMEADINVIVDVEPGEAGVLIELIEMLFDEWYKARHKREERLARVAQVAADKKKQLEDAKSGHTKLDSNAEQSSTS